MKKVSLIVLAVLLAFSCLCFVGCEPKSNLDVEYLPDATNQPVGNGGSDATVRIIQYTWDGWGTSYKDVTGATAEKIGSLLAALPETNETQPALSLTRKFPEKLGTACDLPAERGTMWVEANGKIYRLSGDKILLVKKHLGKGTVLGDAAECIAEIANAWSYWPMDCWYGTYKEGKLSMEHRYEAETTVTVNIVSMNVIKDLHPENSMTVELTSTIDQTVHISLDCWSSSDNLSTGDKKDVEVVAGQPKTVELTFGGFPFTYDVVIRVDNTSVKLVVDPE